MLLTGSGLIKSCSTCKSCDLVLSLTFHCLLEKLWCQYYSATTYTWINLFLINPRPGVSKFPKFLYIPSYISLSFFLFLWGFDNSFLTSSAQSCKEKKTDEYWEKISWPLLLSISTQIALGLLYLPTVNCCVDYIMCILTKKRAIKRLWKYFPFILCLDKMFLLYYDNYVYYCSVEC